PTHILSTMLSWNPPSILPASYHRPILLCAPVAQSCLFILSPQRLALSLERTALLGSPGTPFSRMASGAPGSIFYLGLGFLCSVNSASLRPPCSSLCDLCVIVPLSFSVLLGSRERHSPEWRRVPQVRFFTWVLGS